ncbi:D-aminoacyl-tRNA deacylase [Halovivax limisalsi]|uniref:D-aminoacyl-tRNA deacylase n=1 Tax=Halovivax limisalsi TaxID=1453760 RepID=UPI001FFD338E|nr:D-aminoacyl-tRNA deacylase [Halovivax limisalsi]
MIAIVESRADRASVHVCDQLRRLAAWDERVDDARSDADGGGTYYRTDGFELRSFDALHLDLVRPDEAFGESPDVLVFASRHSGETGPLLSAHFTGNVGPAEFGGETNAVATAAPNALATLLEAYDRHAPEEYEVGMECTHHGPSDVGCPSLFAELGSDDAQWDDPAGAEAVARAILDLRGVSPHRIDPESGRPRQLVGFGGGHYVPRFERIVRETAWTVGHVAADWGLDALEGVASESALVRALFEASTATHAVVEGTRPALVRTIDDLGYRVVSEAWVREVEDRPLTLVDAVESALGPVADGVRFGDRRTESFDVISPAPDLVSRAEGIDAERTWDVVTAGSVAVETANGGSRLGERIAVPIDVETNRSPAGVPRQIVDGLADVIRSGADAVTVSDGAVVVEETAFDPDRARELGVPDGPAFGKLAEGETVSVDGTVVEPDDVHETRTTRYAI